MPRLFFLLFGMLLVVLSIQSSARAAEKITFLAKSSLKQSVLTLLDSYSFSALAFVDLNQDGLDDYILQSHDSDAYQNIFVIVARGDNKVITLGSIKAKRLMVSHQREDGVRNILAYQSEINDFDYKTYHWDFDSLSYIDTRSRSESETL